MKAKAYRYTCAGCGEKQTFKPGDPKSQPLLESHRADDEETTLWPICPKCGTRNSISPQKDAP